MDTTEQQPIGKWAGREGGGEARASSPCLDQHGSYGYRHGWHPWTGCLSQSSTWPSLEQQPRVGSRPVFAAMLLRSVHLEIWGK